MHVKITCFCCNTDAHYQDLQSAEQGLRARDFMTSMNPDDKDVFPVCKNCYETLGVKDINDAFDERQKKLYKILEVHQDRALREILAIVLANREKTIPKLAIVPNGEVH